MKKKNTMNWSDALPEIIGSIFERLPSVEDCSSFRGVCTSWRSAVLHHPHASNVSLKAIPWIMFTREIDGDIPTHEFFSLSAGNKYYKFNFPPYTNRLPITGSPYGWVVLQKDAENLEIFNPLTCVRVPLPLLSAVTGYSNIVLAMSPSSLSTSPPKDRFMVFVISVIEGKVAFTTPGDKNWTSIDFVVKSCCDVFLLNSHVYVVDKEGLVSRFDITGATPIELEFALPPADIGSEVKRVYLVEILGDLHMVVYQINFRVFKLDLQTRKWKEVFTLGDYAIFVGPTSFSFPVSDYPESKSCICSTEVSYKSEQLRIFYLETRTSYVADLGIDASKQYSHSSWFIPSLN